MRKAIEKKSEKVMPTFWPTYTKSDLDNFAALLDRHRDEKGIINLDEAMVEFGALKKSVHAGRTAYSVIVHPIIEQSVVQLGRTPIKFELFDHIYRALRERSFAKKKQNERYDKMSGEEINAADLFTESKKIVKDFPE
jgi:hypothetical protein